MANSKNNPFYNSSCKADPTAYMALSDRDREQELQAEEQALLEHIEAERKLKILMKVIKFIISESGFELLNRVELKHRGTGRIYR